MEALRLQQMYAELLAAAPIQSPEWRAYVTIAYGLRDFRISSAKRLAQRKQAEYNRMLNKADVLADLEFTRFIIGQRTVYRHFLYEVAKIEQAQRKVKVAA